MKHVSFSSGARLRLAGLLAVALCSVPAAADAPSPSASVAPAPPASAAPVAPAAPSASPPASAPPVQSAPPPPPSPPVPTTGAPAAAWEKIGDSDGIVTYRREVPGSPLIAVKGDGVVNASIVRVASILVDTTRATEWIDRLVDTRVVREISDTESIHYDHIGTPVVMKDRDFVTRTKLEFDPANKKLIIRLHSVTDPLAPPTDYVRGEIMQSYFVLTSTDHGTKTHVSVEVHADPKGSVAKWIVNMFQKSWPHNTLSRLRMQAAKTDIKDHARLKTVLTQSGYLN